MTTHLGRRLVTYAHTGHCLDREHPVDLITDGVVFYANSPSTDVDVIHRDGVTLTATCPEPVNADAQHEGEPCGSTITWRLDDDHWTAARRELQDLEIYGDPDPTRRVTLNGPVTL